MKIFDSHAHIGLISEDQIEQLYAVKEALHTGVSNIVSINSNLESFVSVYENLKTASNVYHAVGLAPSEVTRQESGWEEQIMTYATRERVVAIGETGLDYFRKFGSKKEQIELFIKQLALAKETNLPVVVHNRGAGSDVIKILRQQIPQRGAILHCYSEDWKFAQNCFDLPIYISFAGNVTYKNARNLHETAALMPLDKMLIESESPFMPPASHRGKRNRPAYLPEVVAFIAELRDESEDVIADALYKNCCAVFNIPA